MPYNSMGVWEDDDYASGGMAPSGGSGGAAIAPVSAPSFNGWTPQQTSGNQSFLDYMGANPSVASQAPSDFWIPSGASYGNNPSGAINQQNPFANPGKEFVQGGDSGGWIDGVGPTLGQGSSITKAQADASWKAAMAAGVPQEWAMDFLRRNTSATGVPDINRLTDAYRSENQGDRDKGYPRDPLQGGGSGGSGSGNSSGKLSNPQFSGAGGLIEQYATDRFGQLTNPDPNSGTALFEKYARELIDTLKGPVYSAGDEAVIKGSALDTIERDRAATRQRWLEETSRRGINPSSGIALQGLQKIDDQFGQYRTTVEAQFARDAIGQTRQQRQQVLSTAGQLAGSEEGRLDKAGTYAYMPYGLEQDAFSRNLALVGASGSPQSTLQSALSLLSANQSQNAYNQQQQQQNIAGIMQMLGWMFP